jgi:hypothetical protein
MKISLTHFQFICYAFIRFTAGQLANWVKTNEFDEIIPIGVSVYTSYVQSQPSLHAWLIVADMNKLGSEWSFETVLSKDPLDKLSPITQFASDYRSKIATNGGFFGTSNGIGISYSLVAHR